MANTLNDPILRDLLLNLVEPRVLSLHKANRLSQIDKGYRAIRTIKEYSSFESCYRYRLEIDYDMSGYGYYIFKIGKNGEVYG